MALQSDAIQSRLEGLKTEDRRTLFDSHLRAFRRESESPEAVANRESKPANNPAPNETIDRVILLIEDLSRRIDGLEKKDRSLALEIRQRVRQDQRRRSIYLAGGLASAGLMVLGWLLGWI